MIKFFFLELTIARFRGPIFQEARVLRALGSQKVTFSNYKHSV